MATLDYAHEKLSEAAQELATDALPLRDRLERAYLAIHMLDQRDFVGGEMRQLHSEIASALTAETPLVRGQGSVAATLKKMTANDMNQIAGKIAQLLGLVTASRLKPGDGK